MTEQEEWTSLDDAVPEISFQAAVNERIDFLRIDRQAKRDLDAEEATDGLDEAEMSTFFKERMLPDDEQTWSIQGLLPEDGRGLLAGYRKAGKTLLALNLASAWANPLGAFFLGRFWCEPLAKNERVLWLNMELTRKQARRWMKKLPMNERTAKRIMGAHIRGRVSAYSPITTHGRAALVELLSASKTKRLIVDPVAPLMAACGLNITDPRDTQMFLNAMDRICREAGVREIVYLTHVGKSDAKANDGLETAIGAERWESAVDAIWTVGKEAESGVRWFRAEGRDVDVPETNIVLDDETGELTLDAGTTGKGRRASRLDALVERAVDIVEQNPGINKGDLRNHSLMGAKSKDASSAIATAVQLGRIRTEKGPSNSILHFPGSDTASTEVAG